MIGESPRVGLVYASDQGKLSIERLKHSEASGKHGPSQRQSFEKKDEHRNRLMAGKLQVGRPGSSRPASVKLL